MARSEEAILRRALKRNRTEGEQRQADRNEMKRQAEKQQAKKAASDGNHKRQRVSDPRSGKQNFSDRRNPSVQDRSRNPRRNTPTSTKKSQRHDEETSKKLVWARQADSKTITKNQELRQRFKETGGEGMSPEDLERAKLLLARDQRKQERKDKKKKNKTAESGANASKTEEGAGTETPKKEQVTTDDPDKSASKSKKEKTSDAQAKRDQNKALRLRYLETNGKGMKEDQIERAKLLIARDEKKKQKRAEKQKSEKKQ